MERRITFEATLNDETGNLNLTRMAAIKFTSIEMIGILESFKLQILKETLIAEPISHKNAKKKKSIDVK